MLYYTKEGLGGVIQTFVCPVGFLRDCFPCANRDRQEAAARGRSSARNVCPPHSPSKCIEVFKRCFSNPSTAASTRVRVWDEPGCSLSLPGSLDVTSPGQAAPPEIKTSIIFMQLILRQFQLAFSDLQQFSITDFPRIISDSHG